MAESSKKLDVERMTGRTVYIAYPSGQVSKLTLKCYSRYKPITDNLTQYPDRADPVLKNIYILANLADFKKYLAGIKERAPTLPDICMCPS